MTDDPSIDMEPNELAKALKSLHTLTFSDRGWSLLFVAGWDQPLCGATGNCQYWVLDEQNNILLETSAKAVTVLGSSHHERPDLLFSSHDSASDTDRERWYFNGKKYELKWCGTSTYGDLGHEYKHPKTFQHSCRE
jgi:hypothetical protein